MTNAPRSIRITQSKGTWREHEIDIAFEVGPGMTTVLNVSREEANIICEELSRYLGETND